MTGTRTTFVALAGVLLCLGVWCAMDLLAATPHPKRETAPANGPEGGKLVGILTHFEYIWTKTHGPKPDTRVSLKAEGETEPVDYLLALPGEAVDPKTEAALRGVFPSNTVSMQWEMRDGKRLVTKITVLTPTGGQGVARGTVMARDAGNLDLKGENRGDITVRYVVPWDAKAKGPIPALSEAVKGLNVGDKVMIAWNANPERLWLNNVKLLSHAPAGKPAAGSKTKPSKPTQPKPPAE
jgi:hypothetical protein